MTDATRIPDPLPEVRLSAVSYTASHYCYRLTEDDGTPRFDVDAPYQRGSVWSLEQRRSLIRSLLLGVPVGSMVISLLPYREKRPSYRVVDGKQRIEALQAFYHGGFAVPGWWFDLECFDDPAARVRDVTSADLNRLGMHRIFERPLPVLEFKGDLEWTKNPDYDPTRERDKDGNRLYLTRRRSDEEIVQAEADLYLLINFGGVAQTDADRARAASLASVESLPLYPEGAP